MGNRIQQSLKIIKIDLLTILHTVWKSLPSDTFHPRGTMGNSVVWWKWISTLSYPNWTERILYWRTVLHCHFIQTKCWGMKSYNTIQYMFGCVHGYQSATFSQSYCTSSVRVQNLCTSIKFGRNGCDNLHVPHSMQERDKSDAGGFSSCSWKWTFVRV